MSDRRPPAVDQPLLVSEAAVTFYSCYLQENHIVWPEPYEAIQEYELYRNGVSIAVADVSDKEIDFNRPIYFDNDKETNLYFKSSLHKWHFTDSKVNKHALYKYQVVGRRANEDGELMDVWTTHEMEVWTE